MATITFQGKPLQTSGDLPPVGSAAPDFSLVNGRLQDINMGSFQGKKKILNIVPSMDTPVCAASTRRFNEKAGKLDNTVVLNISADLPFAQDRFCRTEGLKNIIPLSTFRSDFANDYGVKMIEGALSGLTARAVVVIDATDRVIYSQMISEITEEPDYEAVLAVL